MNIAYSLSLVCSQCGADVVLTGSDTRDDMYVARRLGRKYESGQPKPKIRWRRDGFLIKKLNEARRWVLENPTADYNIFDTKSPTFPTYVGWAFSGASKMTTYVKPVEFRFVDCPACGGRAYMGSKRDSAISS